MAYGLWLLSLIKVYKVYRPGEKRRCPVANIKLEAFWPVLDSSAWIHSTFKKKVSPLTMNIQESARE